MGEPAATQAAQKILGRENIEKLTAKLTALSALDGFIGGATGEEKRGRSESLSICATSPTALGGRGSVGYGALALEGAT